jgi:hypothetical protein
VLKEARSAHQPYRCQLLGAHLGRPFSCRCKEGSPSAPTSRQANHGRTQCTDQRL